MTNLSRLEFSRSSPFLALATFASVLLLALAGCGVAPQGDESEEAQNQANNAKLVETYSQVVGVYKGSLNIRAPVIFGDQDKSKNQTRELGGQVLIYVDNISNGYNRRGAPVTHPQLFAQLKFEGVGELDDTTFMVDYDRIIGSVNFKQPQQPAAGAGGSSGGTGSGTSSGGTTSGTVRACPVGPRDPQLSMAGTILGSNFTGSVNGSSGPLGTIKMQRTSTGESQPIRDQAERLKAAYAKIQGEWQGQSTITREGRTAASSGARAVKANSSLFITVDEVAFGEGVTCPQLRAQFRLNDLIGRLDDTYLGVEYREGTGELYLTAVADPANLKVCPIGPKDMKLALTGIIGGDSPNQTVSGVMQGSYGIMGPFALKRTNAVATAPEDQRERLYAAYSKIAGTYAGFFSSSSGSELSFPTQINLDVVDAPATSSPSGIPDQFLTCPALKGQYIRPDLVSGAGALVLNATYVPLESRLTIDSVTQSQTGVPGHTYLNIKGVWNGNGFSGPMQWWNRNGTIKAVRCSGTSVSRSGACR